MTASVWLDKSAPERAADAVLRAAGGRTVLLRLPANAGAGDAEQLGLASPRMRDMPIGPAAFRKSGGTKTLLLSARGARMTLGAVGAGSTEAMFRSAEGIVVDGELYRIEDVVAMGSVGAPHCWALTLRAEA